MIGHLIDRTMPYFAALAAGVVFWLDLQWRYDLTISILYLGVLVLVARAGTIRRITAAAALCMALTVLAWFVTRPAGAALVDLARCLFPCIAIGVTAALLVSRKRLEAARRALDRSRAEVEHFANSVPFVLWRSNPRGEIEYLNESWTVVTGLDRWSVLRDARYNDVVHPDDRPILNATVAHAVATRTMTDVKVRIRQADGSYRWMQIYDKPVHSPLTDQVERFGGLSDVHDEVVAKQELQRVRNALEESQRELTVFADSVPQLLWRATADGNWDFLNRRFTEITGVEREDGIAGQTWRECVHPEDLAKLRVHLERSLVTGEDVAGQVRLRHKHGGYRWMSMARRAVRSPETGEILRFYGGATDIHEEVLARQKIDDLMATLEQRVAERTRELMQTEARYASLFDVGGSSFAEIDFGAIRPLMARLKADGVTDLRAHFLASPELLDACLANITITRVNRAMARLMGYDSPAELVANPPDREAGEGREYLLRQIEMIFYEIGHIDGRVVLAGKGGRRIPVYFAINRLADGLHLANLVDLSEQHRIDEMQRAAQDELARANRIATVGAYSATIAHELNQPIASMAMDVQTALHWLRQTAPNLDSAISAVERLTRTVDRVQRIVAHTRASLAPRRHAPQAVDVAALAQETCDLLDGEVRRAGALLTLRCDPGLDPVLADPVELQQVLVNLITNAAEAMAADCAIRKITVCVARDPDGIAVSVRDTGPGIPEALIARVFEPFFTTKPTGMGMGLQVCRNAVLGMGGDLAVSNAAGGGAQFSFTLPTGALTAA